MQNEIIVGAIALTVGAAGGYFVTKKILDKKYVEQLDQEITQTRDFYEKLNKTGAFENPISAAEKLLVDDAADAILKYKGEEPAFRYNAPVEEMQGQPMSPIIIDEVHNVFENEDARVLDILDTGNRSADKPYIITIDEMVEGQDEYDQVDLTYYAGDGGLADDKDEPIDAIKQLVGEDFIQHFGFESGADDVVIIRNERIKTDFAITEHKGSFKHVVLGMDEELKHSDDTRRRRQSWTD